MNNVPTQYTHGYVEFYKLKFKVTSDVLIPRPETELLVDEVLNFCKILDTKYQILNSIILDIGTGSGNIAISIAKNEPHCQIIATDICQKALKIAQQNAKLHQVADKIQFVQSNLLDNPQILDTNKYHILIIVTNLPYIPTSRISYLDESVKDYEPHIALDGGEDGFALYRKLLQQIKDKLWQPNLIIGEIDYTHGELAVSEALNYFPDYQVEVKKDLAHKQRVLIIQKLPGRSGSMSGLGRGGGPTTIVPSRHRHTTPQNE